MGIGAACRKNEIFRTKIRFDISLQMKKKSWFGKMDYIILLQLQNKSKHGGAYSESLQQLNKYNLSGNLECNFFES